jgi:hypothetical protein
MAAEQFGVYDRRHQQTESVIVFITVFVRHFVR